MKKPTKIFLPLFVLCIVLIVFLPVSAQEDSGKTELKKALQSQDVQQELAEPDGASITPLPDGGWRLFGVGTGTYDFNDPDDINDATQEATLKAKAHLAKYLTERITSDEGLDILTQKKRTLVKQSGGDEKSVKKDDTKTFAYKIKNSADKILKGVIVLESTKTPSATGGGTVVVKVGVSSKSQRLAGTIESDLKNETNYPTVKAGQKIPPQEDTVERKRSKSDF
jgi:hypothetical protein